MRDSKADPALVALAEEWERTAAEPDDPMESFRGLAFDNGWKRAYGKCAGQLRETIGGGLVLMPPPSERLRLMNARALLAEAEKMIRDKPEAERSGAEKNLLFDIEAMKERC